MLGIVLALAACTTAAPEAPPMPLQYQMVAADAAEQARLRDAAVDHLRSMTKDEYALYRANAIEALQAEPALGEAAAREGLLDPNLGVRFVSAMAIGQQRYAAAAPLAHALLRDESESVQVAAIFALLRNGIHADPSLLGRLLRSPDPRVAGNAALVLGELGDPSAVAMLHDAIEYNSIQATHQQNRLVQLQMAEAMAKLGDETAIGRIRAQLYSRRPEEGELTALAASILGPLGAISTVQDLRGIVGMWRQYRNSAEVRLAALASLAQLGDPLPIELVLEYVHEVWEQPPGQGQASPAYAYSAAVHAQAAYALGQYPAVQALPYLARLFHESVEPEVRLQAAAAIVRILPPG